MSLLLLLTNYTAEYGLASVEDNEGSQANVIIKGSGALTQPQTFTYIGPSRAGLPIVMPAPTIGSDGRPT